MKRSKRGSSFSRRRKPSVWRRHCSMANRVAVWRQSEVDFYKVLGHGVFLPERWLNQSKATSVCIRSMNQSNRFISARFLFLFCSHVFISRSNENCPTPNSRCRPRIVFLLFLLWSAITHLENNSNSFPGLLGYRFNNLQLCCTFDVIGSIWQNSSKFGRQEMVMMNYACDFNQSETEKYFEYIINTNIRTL